MTPKEYQEACLRTECSQVFARNRMNGRLGEEGAFLHQHGERDTLPVRLNHGAFGIAKEAGEILSVLEKWIYYGQPISLADLRSKFILDLGS